MEIATMLRSRAGCVAVMAIAGCSGTGCIVLPIPHRNVEVMPVAGVLRERGVPVADRALSVEQRRWNGAGQVEPCSGVSPVVTDASGAFHFPPRLRWRFWVLLVGESEGWHIPVRLCMRDQQGWRPLHLTIANGWEELELACDLSGPVIDDSRTGEKGVCVASRRWQPPATE
jgi:hypothetical protein